jgi:hypothetical protein
MLQMTIALNTRRQRSMSALADFATVKLTFLVAMPLLPVYMTY